MTSFWNYYELYFGQYGEWPIYAGCVFIGFLLSHLIKSKQPTAPIRESPKLSKDDTYQFNHDRQQVYDAKLSAMQVEMYAVYAAIGRTFQTATPAGKKEALETLELHEKCFKLMVELLRESSKAWEIHSNNVGANTIMAYLYELCDHIRRGNETANFELQTRRYHSALDEYHKSEQEFQMKIMASLTANHTTVAPRA